MTQFEQLHLGGTAAHPEGGTTTITVPVNTRSIYMKADGAAYYAVNGTAAGTDSPGYIASGGTDMVFTSENIATLSVEAAAGVTVYIQYYSA